MAEYRIVMERDPNISDDERRRRLASAYRIILNCARKSNEQKTTDQDSLEGDAQSVADTSIPKDASKRSV